jgi:catechol 2,3-dioxygenase-like lactoylglutathione lyase family enzyme
VKPILGFVGIGNIGEPVCRNLLEGGYRLLVYDVDPGALARLCDTRERLGDDSYMDLRSNGASEPGSLPTGSVVDLRPRRLIAHTSLPVSNYARSKTFYIKALEPLGYKNNMEYGEAAGFNDGKNTDFWISQHDKPVATHVAFEAKSQKEVEAFYKAALAAGGKDNGAPGYRDYWPGYYAAFVYDPDGNNIEAVWYDYSKDKKSG